MIILVFILIFFFIAHPFSIAMNSRPANARKMRWYFLLLYLLAVVLGFFLTIGILMTSMPTGKFELGLDLSLSLVASMLTIVYLPIVSYSLTRILRWLFTTAFPATSHRFMFYLLLSALALGEFILLVLFLFLLSNAH